MDHLAVLAAVLLVVLHADRSEAFADGAGGLIRGKDALARRGDVARGGDKLSSEF